MSFDADAAERVRRALSGRGEVAEKRMVGGLSFLVNGNMCCGITGTALMIRVGADRREEALREPHVRPMAFGGRVLSGFIASNRQAMRLMMRSPAGFSGASTSSPGSRLSLATRAADVALAASAAGAAYGIDAVAEQLAEQQVAVLLLAADLAPDGDGASYRIGRRPTEFIVGDSDVGTEVPLEDGLVWAALHQDAIVVRLPDRSGPLAGQLVAALLHRG